MLEWLILIPLVLAFGFLILAIYHVHQATVYNRIASKILSNQELTEKERKIVKKVTEESN